MGTTQRRVMIATVVWYRWCARIAIGLGAVKAIHRLSYGGSTRHHIRTLGSHCLRALLRRLDGLRCHGLRAARWWWTAEDIREGSISLVVRRLPIVGWSCILPPLLSTVVCHILLRKVTLTGEHESNIGFQAFVILFAAFVKWRWRWEGGGAAAERYAVLARSGPKCRGEH
jgi:hypothetical protein